MIVVVKRAGGKAMHVPARLALAYWRAFRGALWERGIKRDPRVGDEIDGVQIIGLTI